MHIIRCRNVNDALHEGLWHMHTCGVKQGSRNGDVITVPYPVMTIYERPWQKVLYSENRNANPFFHLMEAMWMLAGCSDVAFVACYNPRMREFADMGILRGAYGERWRKHWVDEGGDQIDQIEMAIHMLRNDPRSRRVVISMWDPSDDLGTDVKDIPCNTQIYFRVVGGKLDMTLTCRSNDIVWGAYGANAVHFGFLHELVAAGAGYPQGNLYQLSNNWHIYERHWGMIGKSDWDGCPYEMADHPYVPLVNIANKESYKDVLHDAEVRTGVLPIADMRTFFFRAVVVPMQESWDYYKRGSMLEAIDVLERTYPSEWIDAGLNWLRRRQ